MTARPFPPPWSVEDIGAAFVVKDSSGQKLGFVILTSRVVDKVRRNFNDQGIAPPARRLKIPLRKGGGKNLMDQLAAALGCALSLYGVDAYYCDGWYASHISTLLSQIYIHFCP
jgi:hypothetical protein